MDLTVQSRWSGRLTWTTDKHGMSAESTHSGRDQVKVVVVVGAGSGEANSLAEREDCGFLGSAAAALSSFSHLGLILAAERQTVRQGYLRRHMDGDLQHEPEPEEEEVMKQLNNNKETPRKASLWGRKLKISLLLAVDDDQDCPRLLCLSGVDRHASKFANFSRDLRSLAAN